MLFVYFFSILFVAISSFIPVMNFLVDGVVPYGIVFVVPPLVETIITGIIPALRTFTFKKRKSKAVDCRDDALALILSDKLMRKKFLEFSKACFSPEALLLWNEIEKFKTEKSRNKRIQIYEHIVDTFLLDNSPMELNLPKETRHDYIQYFEQHKLDKTTQESFDQECLEPLRKSCEQNMVDLYTRFISQKTVKQFLLKLSKS